MNLNNIENSIQSLESEVNSLKGQVKLLGNQYEETVKKLKDLKELQIINVKAIGLLDLVQKATTELIKEMFEEIVSKALQYVYQSNDYKFELEFNKHGNTPKLSFNLKTPDMQESHSILDCRAGGSKDIIALALRFVLLEISRNPGFLFLDEPCKRLDNDETIKKTIDFIKETQRDTGRQIFVITHKDEIVNSVPNPIIFKKEMSITTKCPEKSGQLKIDKPKKKRGRPRKNAKKD